MNTQNCGYQFFLNFFYAHALKLYATWCRAHETTEVCESMEAFSVQVANFLADTFKQRTLSFGTMKTYLSAVSTCALVRLRGRVGETAIVKALMEAIHRAVPDKPRYPSAPSLGPLLIELERWPDNDSLDARSLLGKVGALLMLFGLRKADQLNISLSQSEVKPDKDGVIYVSCLTKTIRFT